MSFISSSPNATRSQYLYGITIPIIPRATRLYRQILDSVIWTRCSISLSIPRFLHSSTVHVNVAKHSQHCIKGTVDLYFQFYGYGYSFYGNRSPVSHHSSKKQSSVVAFKLSTTEVDTATTDAAKVVFNLLQSLSGYAYLRR